MQNGAILRLPHYGEYNIKMGVVKGKKRNLCFAQKQMSLFGEYPILQTEKKCGIL
jgi:hypothetical protein